MTTLLQNSVSDVTCTLDKLLDFRQSRKFPPPNKKADLTLCLWEEMGLVWPGYYKNVYLEMFCIVNCKVVFPLYGPFHDTL